MEELVQVVRNAKGCGNAEARLALLVVVDVLREVLTAEEAAIVAETLPVALAVMLRRPDAGEPWLPRGAGDDVDAAAVEAVCTALAERAPADLWWRIGGQAPQLIEARLGRRRAALRISARPTVRVDLSPASTVPAAAPR